MAGHSYRITSPKPLQIKNKQRTIDYNQLYYLIKHIRFWIIKNLLNLLVLLFQGCL
ncbi:hypothetical protein EV07_1208 [Prochlorococcus sp. MIT 0603]|nr:hypothetical protein EV07_1208 [Prochlorococcus sp. MIT 0603]